MSESDLEKAIRRTNEAVIEFVCTPEFRSVVKELYDLPVSARQEFVESVLIDESELASRGVDVPDGIIIQRSKFGDMRDTLFCVTKYLDEEYHDDWEKVTVTFDNEPYPEQEAPSEVAWSNPLSPDEMRAKEENKIV